MQAPLKPLFRLENASVQVLPALMNQSINGQLVTIDTTRELTARPAGGSMLGAQNDAEAALAWVQAHTSSKATARSYEKEVRRFMLWCQRERAGVTFAQLTIEDCRAYQLFLQHIPQSWISREGASPGTAGWAPFRGALSHASQDQAIKTIGALFVWLNAARYITGNPWMLLNTDTGVKVEGNALDTKALSPVAVGEILRYMDEQPPSPSRNRARFIVSFVEAVGLRSAELLSAQLGDFSMQPEGWTLKVVGKGSRARTVIVTRPAMDALQLYLEKRALGGIETAPPHAPLVASATDPMESITYQAMYTSVKSWIQKAIKASDLPARERQELAGATTHWLRHTFATKAIAREVPMDVVQAQLGHASIQTTMSIYSRAPIRRRSDELHRAFD